MRFADELRNLPRHRATICIAEHDDIGATLGGCRERIETVFHIKLRSVKEVLGIIDDFFALRLEISQAVLNHIQVFAGGSLQHVSNMQHRGLANDGDRRCFSLDKGANIWIVFWLDAFSSRRAKSRNLRVFQIQLANLIKVHHIFGI